MNTRLRAEVERRLGHNDSPEQIANRLPLDFPDDPEMRVSHETIYTSIYVQGRGALRKDLAGHLRTGRAMRKPRAQARRAHAAAAGARCATWSRSASAHPRSRTGPCQVTGKAT